MWLDGVNVYAFGQANWFQRMMRLSGAVPPISWLYARTLHHLDRVVYKLTRGRATFVSLVTGLPIYGQQRNPAWYYNLRADPHVTITFGGATRQMAARELEGELTPAS